MQSSFSHKQENGENIAYRKEFGTEQNIYWLELSKLLYLSPSRPILTAPHLCVRHEELTQSWGYAVLGDTEYA